MYLVKDLLNSPKLDEYVYKEERSCGEISPQLFDRLMVSGINLVQIERTLLYREGQKNINNVFFFDWTIFNSDTTMFLHFVGTYLILVTQVFVIFCKNTLVLDDDIYDVFYTY